MNVSVVGAGSTYGIFLVKWALLLKHYPVTNRENIPIPSIEDISYSNTTERNKNLVQEVLVDDLSHMPYFMDKELDKIVSGIHGYTNWREMMAKETPGLVTICSPLETHVPYIRELLADFKTKNILCEPPLSHIHEIESLPNLVQMAREKNVAIGMNMQYAALYERLWSLPLNPNAPETFADLVNGTTALEIFFITHGTRLWRKMQAVGEQEILEDLGPHVYELIPERLRREKLTVKNVKKEGDNLFLNFVEYELLLGNIHIKITLGYHRKLKSLKLIFKKGKKNYEYHVSGAVNPGTGEFTRWIEGKNYAYPFKHFLDTDLVKSSFISSLAGKPVVSIEEGIRSLEFAKTLYTR